MKTGIKEIVGKKIRQVIVSQNRFREPRQQVFVIFEDGTFFEFYGNDFNCSGSVARGGSADVTCYAAGSGAEVVATH